MRVIFLGAPGSGKGTQSKFICAKKIIPQLSTGDMLRAAVKAGTDVGKKAQAIMESGGLVSDDIIVGIIKDRTAQNDCSGGYILDGFPRTIAQAESLREMLNDQGQKLDGVVYLEIDKEKVVGRLTGRRVCSECGAEYHLEFRRPQREGICDHDGKPLIHRADDHEEKIRNRLQNYEDQTAPLVSFYDKEGILKRVSADGEISEITERILGVLS